MVKEKNLEEALKNPMDTFDYVNSKIWKNPSDPQIWKLISETRRKIELESDKSVQYEMVAGYMLTIQKTFSDTKKDSFDIPDYVIQVIQAMREKSGVRYEQ